MGCYPLGKMISRAFHKCNGRERRRNERLDYSMSYPPAQTHYVRPAARTVTFSDHTSVYTIPPEQPQTQPEPEPRPAQPEPAPPPPPSPPRARPRPKPKEPGRVRFAPRPEPEINRAEPPSPAHPAPCGYRYVPSPLPRWEATPKRHEYFSGEYRYYPTPVREGIYSIATDANRLTTIFSEENPNACRIA